MITRFELYNVVGIDELEQDINFLVYPNPSNGLFNVELNTKGKELEENARLIVYNMMGQELVTAPLHLNGNYQYKTRINLTNQPTGLYLVRLLSKNTTFSTKICLR